VPGKITPLPLIKRKQTQMYTKLPHVDTALWIPTWYSKDVTRTPRMQKIPAYYHLSKASRKPTWLYLNNRVIISRSTAAEAVIQPCRTNSNNNVPGPNPDFEIAWA
jgi:hypothetical protein